MHPLTSGSIRLVLLACLCFKSTQSRCQIFINEFLASNVITNPDNCDFDDYSDWLELYNAGNTVIDLGGWFLTDNLNNPTKWQIPDGTRIDSGGYLLFWADGRNEVPGKHHIRPWTVTWGQGMQETFVTRRYHLNFRLSKRGEEIGLYGPDTIPVDQVTFRSQWPDVSYGREPDGGASWQYFGEPTPEAANATDGVNWFSFAGEPVILPGGGVYTDGQLVSLSADSPEATIRFTTDGSMPTSTSANYTDPLLIAQTTVVRARVFESGKLPGRIITQTYLVDEAHDMPVISIAAFPSTLWDNQIGIYNNQLKQREIPVTIEFYEPEGGEGFKMDGGLTLSGEFSLYSSQKPITIYTKSRFGQNEIVYQIFQDKRISSFKAIYLRNSGFPDHYYTLFRDALSHSLVINSMDIDCQSYRPVVVYLNGEYWGIYNMREKLNEDYLVSNHGVHRDSLDILEYWGEETPRIVEGSSTDFNRMLNDLNVMDLEIPANYQWICERMDVDEYMNYMISEIYFANWTWLNINIKWWRERSGRSKWRWILFDTDMGFGTPTEDIPDAGYMHNTLAYALSTYGGMNNPPWSTFLFRKMMENQGFRYEFIQRFASFLNTSFQSEHVLGVIDSLKTNLSGEIDRHIQRWRSGPPSPLGPEPISTVSEWEGNVRIMEAFARNRPYFVRQHILRQFHLSGTASVHLRVEEPGGGKIYINRVEITDSSKSALYFKDVPFTLKAVPNAGFEFVNWQGMNGDNADSVTMIVDRDTTLTAVFAPEGSSVIPSEITGSVHLTVEGSPYITNRDIIVLPDASLRVEAGTEIRMSEGAGIYVYGEIHLEGNEVAPVVIRPNFKSGAEWWGAICFKDATGPSTLSHVNVEKATKGRDLILQKAAITGYDSDLSLNHVEVKADFPFFAQGGKIKISHCVFRSSRTCDLINIRDTDSALVEHCLLEGNNKYDTDAIDFDNVNNGLIRDNKIWNFTGVNSDGIDLGEGARDILIERNLIYNCTDKGISVGQASTATARRNVIVNCAQGIGVKDFNSHIIADHNTFFGNSYGIASFEKNFLSGGGNAEISNSIISGSIIACYLTDDQSDISISYSLSDTDPLPGPTNIFGDPMFRDTASLDFHLRSGSPCIDAGDPESAPDPDGSRADIGAFEYIPVEIQPDPPVIRSWWIYPNPVRDHISIEMQDPGDYCLDLISINGQVLMNRCFQGKDFFLDLSPFPKGAYLISIRAVDSVSTRKIIKL